MFTKIKARDQSFEGDQEMGPGTRAVTRNLKVKLEQRPETRTPFQIKSDRDSESESESRFKFKFKFRVSSKLDLVREREPDRD